MELKTVTLNCLKNALVKIQTHLRKEGELMRELKAFLNQKVAGRTTEEYQVDCADKIKKAKAVSDLKKQKSMLKKTKTN
jgi:uncharacterized protein (UPF0332 family)